MAKRWCREIHSIAEELIGEHEPEPFTYFHSTLHAGPYKYRSGVVRVDWYSGGAHPNSFTRSWTVNRHGVLMELQDVVAVSFGEAMSRISKIALSGGRSHWKDHLEPEDVTTWYPDVKDGETGITVVFDTYVLGCYADGEYEFFVPMPLRIPDQSSRSRKWWEVAAALASPFIESAVQELAQRLVLQRDVKTGVSW